MDVIRLLPDSVANQIAAGEVIQRPASAVKELVENSVDAGATHITINIKDAGRTLVQVVDNGSGMSDTDARMAFERHATSKIRRADDLFNLSTMGFRGEALASIAAVSQLEVRSMLHNSSLGTCLLINGGKVESQSPWSGVPGTNIMVKNLFYNVPARRKFLKRDSVELANIMREFERLALVNPGLAFTLVHNDVTLHDLRPESMLQRIAHLFGKAYEKQLIPVETDTSIVRISGYVSLPEFARRRGAQQFFMVNGRNMGHPQFRKAIISCYSNLISSEHLPQFFLNFTVDPTTIDVNIHPTKHEIKFENEQGIWQILTSVVRESLGRFNAMPTIEFERENAPDIPVFQPGIGDVIVPDSGSDPDYNPFRQPSPNSIDSRTRDWDKLFEDFSRRSKESFSVPSTSQPSQTPEPESVPLQGELDLDFETTQAPVMQIGNRYILTPSHGSLMIIDQNRAHRLVLYNRLISKANDSSPAQQLLFPEQIVFSPSQNAIMHSVLTELRRTGFEMHPVANESLTWEITGVPAALSDHDVRSLLFAILDDAQTEGSTDDEGLKNLRHRIAMNMAASTAVPAGQSLSREHMDRLVGDLLSLPNPQYTPDGKRTFIHLTLDDLSRMFQ